MSDTREITAPMGEAVAFAVLGPAAYPAAVERSMVLGAASKLAAAQSELMRFLIHGDLGPTFAFEEEVTGMLAEALRVTLEVEHARFASSVIDDPTVQAEKESLQGLLLAIAEFQKEWGRG